MPVPVALPVPVLGANHYEVVHLSDTYHDYDLIWLQYEHGRSFLESIEVYADQFSLKLFVVEFAGVCQGEPLLQHYLLNAGCLQTWGIIIIADYGDR